jgi:hypothetical protein
MNGGSPGPLAIIVAVTDPAAPLFAERLARFAEEAGPQGEVFIIDSSGVLNAYWLASRFPNIRVLYRPIGQLAPQLWRDGLVRTEAPLIAFTTAQMRFGPGWRVALIDRLNETNASGVGGPIAPGASLSLIDRAVALIRYSRYFPPISPKITDEPPGENALYRRDRLRDVEPSWADGFWEIEVHQALRQRGEVLAMASSAVVTFEGGSLWRSILQQRFRHAKRYGAYRSKDANLLVRLAKFVMTPLVPPLLCLRIIRNLLSKRIRLWRWVAAGPGVMLFATVWAIGEAVGVCRRSRIATNKS